jgi:hypothetical protein
MSFTAVRNLTVVSLVVIAGLLISGCLYAETASYAPWDWSKVVNIWGTTFDDKPGNFNRGIYFSQWVNPITGGKEDNPNRDYGIMPQEDTNTISTIDAPFDMTSTSWSATSVDIATQKPKFQTYDNSCDPTFLNGAIYSMNDTDHIYIALILEADHINSADRLFLFFDPDNIQPVAQFVEGSGYCVGVKLGDVTLNEGVGNTVNQPMAFCNGHWKDWDNSGSIDVWEASWPWPYLSTDHGPALATDLINTYPLEKDTQDKNDLTICPRQASEWGDGGTTIPLSGAYWTNPNGDGHINDWVLSGLKSDAIMVQFKVPIEYLGCSLPLGSDIGFAIQWFDDMAPYNGTIDRSCSPEAAWFPQDIEYSGPPGTTPQWDTYDATYMGTMTLNSLNVGNRLWGPWFNIVGDRTSYLVLKNVSDKIAKTKVNFYEAVYGDVTERYAPLPGAGELILATQCVEIKPHGVATLQLEDINDMALKDKKGAIEVTNTDLAGYVISYIGLSTGSLEKYAWSNDLQLTPLTAAQWTAIHGMDSTGMMLANKWYIVGEPGLNLNTSIILFNPNPLNSATARLVLYPAMYWDATKPDTMNLCADVGFHPDFNDNYTGNSPCGDIRNEAADVITIPAHQAIEIKMWEFLNQWVASWIPNQQFDLTQEITDPLNRYWHFRKGTVEIFVQDGNDTNTTNVDESLLGITGRSAAYQGWTETLDRYYE